MKKINSNKLYGYIAISLAMFFWGVSFVWTKQLLNAGFPVFTIVFFRLLLASAVFVTLFKLQGKLEKIQKGDFKYFLMLTLFEPFLYFIGEDFGMQHVDASFASVIIALIPIVVSVTMYFVEDEQIGWPLLLGTLISIGGVALMTFTPGSTMVFNLRGLLWLMLAMLSAGGYSVLLVRLLRKYSPLSVTTYQNLLAIPMYLPFVCVFDLSQWGSLNWNFRAMSSLLCLAVFCSAGAYMCYSYAASKISITKLSVCTNAIPIVTMLVAAILGMEPFTMQKLMGIIVVVSGVVLSQWKRSA